MSVQTPIFGYTPVQSQYLSRLLRLQAMKALEEREGAPSRVRRLIDRATYAAWVECRDAGLDLEARHIVSAASA